MKILFVFALLLSNIGVKWLDSNVKTYDKIQKSIHEYAEPGFLEYKSSALLIDHLKEHGFTVESGVAGMPTAFVATYGSGEPVIGILAEYDALPGLSQDTTARFSPRVEDGYGHGCGHNLLGTGSVAAAVAISKWLKEGHKGTIKVFGCPAEEGGSGKSFMVRDGIFDGVDCAFAWHPSRYNRVHRNTYTAKVGIVFDFEGVSSHAASYPQNGRSALDAVEAMNHMMNLNREHFPFESRVHYVITDGGKAPNIVPAKAQVYYFLRHPDPKELMKIQERTIRAAEGAAMGTGTTVKYSFVSASYPILNNDVLCGLAQKNLEKIGGICLTEEEKAYLSELKRNAGRTEGVYFDRFEDVQPLGNIMTTGGSDDTGDVSQIMPLFKVETCSNIIGSHTWYYASISGTMIGTKALINAAKVLYLTALDIFTKPKELQKAKEEFVSVKGEGYEYVSLIGDAAPPIEFYKQEAAR